MTTNAVTTNEGPTNEGPTHPHYRSPSSIRNETFPRRLRGLDENLVSDYLDELADQVQATDKERRELREENQRLQAELQRARSERSEVEDVGERVNDQVVELFSQAQLVAEEMVEEVSRDARQRLSQAREQERRILEEAMQTAERTRRDAEALIRWTAPGSTGLGEPPTLEASFVREPGHSGADLSPAAAELEQIRAFARAAQEQMQSMMDSFTSGVERLAGAPVSPDAGAWQVVSPRRGGDPRHSG